MNPHKISLGARIALISACFFWAASFIASKIALVHIPPLTVVLFRLMVSSLCFLIWFLVEKKTIPRGNLSFWGKMILLSLFGTGLHYGIQTIGITYTTASNASLYAATGPISITLIAVFFLGERLTLKKTAGIGLALLGVLIVQGINTLKNFRLEGHLLGDILVFLSIVMWGIFTVAGKDMMKRMSAIDLTAIVTFIGTIYMIPISLVEMNRTGFSISSVPLEAWGAVAFLGVTCSFLATFLYFLALQKSESQKVGVYLYTIPPMSYVIAAIFLGEVIGINLLVGSLVVLFGVYLTEKG